MTFDVKSAHLRYSEYDWKRWFEVFAVCQHCNKSTTFVLSQKAYEAGDAIEEFGLEGFETSLNKFMTVESFISLKDMKRTQAHRQNT